jgi:monoamine oxidase
LEVYVHTSNVNLQGSKGMQTYDRRRLEFDAQGYISQLLAKAINQNALDKELDEADRDKLRSLLRKFGDLNEAYEYKGTTRSGCAVPLDLQNGCPSVNNRLTPLGLETLLQTGFWDPCRLGSPSPGCQQTNLPYGFYQVDELLWQTTSFQPVGGMDRIVAALERRVRAAGARVIEGAPVRSIQYDSSSQIVGVTTPRGVFTGQFCASNIPFSIYKDIRTPNADPEYRAAIDRRTFSSSCKVGWQANRRFWELDQQIYGGISWIQHPITQMWYPSYDYFTGKGTLTGAYNYGSTARAFAEENLARRLDIAYAGGQALHGDAFTQAVPKELGVSIAWHKVRHQRGCAAQWILPGDDEATRRQKSADFARLLKPDLEGRFFVVGDQISTLPAWQEGALVSAEHVFREITRRAEDALPKRLEEEPEAPMSLEVMG